MRDDLLLYYERELTFLRQMGAEFADKYPKVASRLLLEPDKCEDPHVERLLEAFAFLAARVHLKIDDEFPEITEALLSILYPHYLRPIPSMSVAEFHLDPEQVTPEDGLEAGARLGALFAAGERRALQVPHLLRPHPLAARSGRSRVEDAGPPAAARQIFRRRGRRAPGSALPGRPDVLASSVSRSLRFYLNGESNLVHTLYELLCNNCVQIVVRDPRRKSRVAAGRTCRRMRCARSGSAKTKACCPTRAARSSATGCCRNTSASRRNSSSSI